MSRRALPVAVVVLLALRPHVGVAQTGLSFLRIPTAEASDLLLRSGDVEGAYRILADHLSKEPDDYEACWRATRNALGLGITGATREVQQEWLRRADAHGESLVRMRPHDPDALAWAAAARGRRALAEDGTRTIARLAKAAWQLTDTVLALDPDHPLGNHVRGKLHQEVARLPAVTRFLARVLLGNSLVGQVSWEAAERHLRRAVEEDPGMVLFYLDLGDTYREEGKTDQARETYRAALDVPDRYPVDEQFKATIRDRLGELARAVSG